MVKGILQNNLVQLDGESSGCFVDVIAHVHKTILEVIPEVSDRRKKIGRGKDREQRCEHS